MKKILFLLLIPVLCFGQIKGDFYLKNRNLEVNKMIIKYFSDNLKYIKSVGNKTKIKIAYEKEFFTKTKSKIIEGFLCQYEVNPLNKEIMIFKPKTKYIEFDFKKKKKSKDSNWSNNDDDDIYKPKDLKEKIKNKIKKKRGIKP